MAVKRKVRADLFKTQATRGEQYECVPFSNPCSYVIPASEIEKLQRHYERCGVKLNRCGRTEAEALSPAGGV